jgi:hypothetical protein
MATKLHERTADVARFSRPSRAVLGPNAKGLPVASSTRLIHGLLGVSCSCVLAELKIDTAMSYSQANADVE